MPTARESRAALRMVTDRAVADAQTRLRSVRGAGPEATRQALMEDIPELIDYYGLGTSALAADLYDDLRDEAGMPGLFAAEPILEEDPERVRNHLAWATAPLFDPGILASVADRLARIVQPEVARPYRETVVRNTRRDPYATGWQRIAGEGACKFCAMLADRGAVYKKDTVDFAAHTSCMCSAQPVFYERVFVEGFHAGDVYSAETGRYGHYALRETGKGTVEASEMQYLGSARSRTPEQRERLRDYLNTLYPDLPG